MLNSGSRFLNQKSQIANRKFKESPPLILVISGSDPSGASGLQRDIMVISSLDAHPLAVPSGLTAQGLTCIRGVHLPPVSFLLNELHSLLDEFSPHAVKIGMVKSIPYIRAIAYSIAERNLSNVVLDPIIHASCGYRLLTSSGMKVMRKGLFPLATIITPNIPEAESFTGLSIHSEEDMIRAAKALKDMGPRHVLIKGGHLQIKNQKSKIKNERPYVADLLYDGKRIEWFRRKGLPYNVRGTGCALSSALCVFISRGYPVKEAVRRGIDYVTKGMREGIFLGPGLPRIMRP